MSDEPSVSPDALRRKQRSMAQLAAEDVPTVDHLPVIESQAEVTLRSTEDAAVRAMALMVVAVKGEGLEQERLDGIVEKYQLADAFSPNETAFMRDTSPSQHDSVQFLWRYEAANTLLWALGFLSELSRPQDICDAAHVTSFLQQRSRDQFIADARLRPVDEILDQADLIYRYNWAVRNARINGHEAPAGLDSGIIQERHYALNWLIGYMGQDWDDISTDT
ncbi:MAG: DUF4272 domain-containing protein [Hyphomicrobiales bacterium]|nr:DUF4272 domain-containing protein [Hyphomicrobiales bacterium]